MPTPAMAHWRAPKFSVRLGARQIDLLARIDRAGGLLKASPLNGGRTPAGAPTPQRDRLEALGLISLEREDMMLTKAGASALAERQR